MPSLTCYEVIAFSNDAPYLDIDISVNPTSGSVMPVGETSTIVTATPISGSTEPVSFSASSLPIGSTALFSPTS